MRKVKLVSFMLVWVLMISTVSSVLFVSAEENELPKSQWRWGDVDGNGEVEIVDATVVQRSLAYMFQPTEGMITRGSFAGNDEFEITDATMIQRHLAYMSVSYPVGELMGFSDDPSDSKYVVTFYDSNGTTVLKRQQVSADDDAVPPSDPSRTGVSFLGWSGNYINVNQNEAVTAVYSDEKNVIKASSIDGQVGNTVTVLVSLEGIVKTCGFDMDIMYDPNLELVSYDDDLDLDIITNPNRYENGMKLNFTSTTDKTKQRDIIELKFRIKNTASRKLPINITVKSIKEIINYNPLNTEYTIIDGIVTVI